MIEVIAKRDKIRVVPIETYALYVLGLSPQISILLESDREKIKAINKKREA